MLARKKYAATPEQSDSQLASQLKSDEGDGADFEPNSTNNTEPHSDSKVASESTPWSGLKKKPIDTDKFGGLDDSELGYEEDSDVDFDDGLESWGVASLKGTSFCNTD